jgi:hypothetical protein
VLPISEARTWTQTKTATTWFHALEAEVFGSSFCTTGSALSCAAVSRVEGWTVKLAGLTPARL